MPCLDAIGVFLKDGDEVLARFTCGDVECPECRRDPGEVRLMATWDDPRIIKLRRILRTVEVA